MKVLMILNDPPYGSGRCYNGLRLAKAMQSKQDVEVSVFLMADSVVCAKRGQKVPLGYYNAEMNDQGRGTQGPRLTVRYLYGRAWTNR